MNVNNHTPIKLQVWPVLEVVSLEDSAADVEDQSSGVAAEPSDVEVRFSEVFSFVTAMATPIAKSSAVPEKRCD
jgi:hypothetical protein